LIGIFARSVVIYYEEVKFVSTAPKVLGTHVIHAHNGTVLMEHQGETEATEEDAEVRGDAEERVTKRLSSTVGTRPNGEKGDSLLSASNEPQRGEVSASTIGRMMGIATSSELK